MNFDRVADIYDSTRTLPPGIDERIADQIIAITHAGPNTRFLELGVGTGRIAAPLIKRGYPFTGVDISQRMLDRLRTKVGDAPNLTLIESDVSQLPLPDNSVDVAVAIHVFHLIPGWRRALDEIRRVLVPGGYFLWGGNDYGEEPIRHRWAETVRELGSSPAQRYGTWAAIQEAMTEEGAYTAAYQAARWDNEVIPVRVLESFRDRVVSWSWPVPEEVLQEAHRRLVLWAAEQYGDVNTARIEQERFVLFASRFS